MNLIKKIVLFNNIIIYKISDIIIKLFIIVIEFAEV